MHDVIVVDQHQLEAELGDVFGVIGIGQAESGDVAARDLDVARFVEQGFDVLADQVGERLDPRENIVDALPVGVARGALELLAGLRQAQRAHAARRRLELVRVLDDLLVALPREGLLQVVHRVGQGIGEGVQQAVVQLGLVAGRLRQHVEIDRFVEVGLKCLRGIDEQGFADQVRTPFLERMAQVLEFDRFRDDVIDARLEALAHVGFERVGGDRDHRGAPLPALLEQANLAHQVVAVHLGHADIGQQQVVAPVAPARQRGRAVDRVIGLVAENVELRGHQFLIDQVVFGNQYARSAFSAAQPGHGAIDHQVHRRSPVELDRFEHDPEDAALTRLADDFELAAHQVEQLARNDETDAGALDAAELGAEAVERLKQFLEFFSRDTAAGIAHADPNALVGAALADYVNLPTVTVVLDRVGQQVQEHLFQPDRVRHDVEAGELVGLEIQVDFALLRQRRDPVHAVGENLLQRNRLERDVGLAGLDPRQVENLVDQRHQVLAGAIDFGRVGEVLLAERLIVGEQLRETHDCVQRGAQFVAHAG